MVPGQLSLSECEQTKELIVDFRKRHLRPYTPLMISGTPVERVSSFKYLGVNISEDLTWTTHIQTQVRKSGKDCTICDSWGNSGSHQQSWKLSIQDHRKCIDSVHLSVVWKQLQSRLQSLAESCALSWEYLWVCSPLPAGHLPQTLQKQSCQNHQDSNHPVTVFSLCCHLVRASAAWWQKTERLRRRFFPQDIRLLNSNSAS